MVEVTQADRDALERIDDALGFLMDNERQIVLEAFVTHREAGHRAGLEEAAGIARKYDFPQNDDSARNMAAIIRNAIRAKIGDGHD